MFHAADSIEQSEATGGARTCCHLGSSAFYVAADVWTRKGGEAWGLGKIFGAFRSPIDFVTQLLEIARTRCFYEIFRADCECKAYFDLEAEPGVWNAEQGREKCKAVILEWERRVLRRWPEAIQECPCCLACKILDGSRMTDEGWKVSHFLQMNDGMLCTAPFHG
jgi:hypothetical protein